MSTDTTTTTDPILAARLALQARGLPADDLTDAAALAVAETIGRLVAAGDALADAAGHLWAASISGAGEEDIPILDSVSHALDAWEAAGGTVRD
jgi:hypothetical protein